MKLRDVLAGLSYEIVKGNELSSIQDIAYDSRNATAGMAFVCLKGALTDGHRYAVNAYLKGVRVFVCENEVPSLRSYEDCTIILVPDTRYALAIMSANFFDFPASRIKLIGITGTKGKTSISFMLKAIFEAAGKKVGLIGSTGCLYDDVKIKLPNTTPESYELHKMFRDMANAGCEYVVLEATSQGFFMHRTAGVTFDVALFTNLSPDHISTIEHPSFEHYLQSKKMIFTQTPLCFVNRDTEYFDEIMENVPCKTVFYGFGEENAYHASHVQCHIVDHKMAVTFACITPHWQEKMRVNIPGEFSASNALAAICVADYFHIAPSHMQQGLREAVVKGRMELVEVPAPYMVMIDFAHNKLSVTHLMETAKKYSPKRIVCVFGLEGNRAKIRRFDSGELIGKYADLNIITSASPRTDDPDAIIADIVTGVERSGGQYITIRDRKEAIIYALDHAEEGDLILLVGKGNVPYEEVNGVNIPFNERDIVNQYFEDHPIYSSVSS